MLSIPVIVGDGIFDIDMLDSLDFSEITVSPFTVKTFSYNMKKLKSICTHLATKSFLGLKAVVLSYNIQHKEKNKRSKLSCLPT